MRTMLFFDDWSLDKRAGFKRQLGTPNLAGESVLALPGRTVGGGYMTAVYDEDRGLYRLWYNDFPTDGHRGLMIRYAESTDGFDWRPQKVTGVEDRWADEFEGLVFSGEHILSEAMVWHDPAEPDPQRRFKMPHTVVERYDPTPIMASRWAYSADGIRWTVDRDHPWLGSISDTANVLLRNPSSGRVQMTMRKRWGDRRVALMESDDLVTWTEPHTIVHPDPLDPRCVQYYGMPQFEYEGYFVGLLWLMHTVADEMGHAKSGGLVDCELTYSHDGLNWNRTVREPFVTNTPAGTYGCGCLYPSSLILAPDGSPRIYAGGSRWPHNGPPEKAANCEPHCAVLSYSLRADGFFKLTAGSEAGHLVTKRLTLNGPELSINASAPRGKVRVQVSDVDANPLPGYSFDECIPFTGDEIAWTPTWREHDDLSAAMHTEHGTRLEVSAENAELFAIRANCGLVLNEGVALDMA